MAEPTANLRVRISADLADIRQGMAVLTRQLREVRGEAARPIPSNNGIKQLGISAGQTAQAMQQLPAQFTDIVTSLQGGMPFFTVLLQQGGQIKDQFGGIEPALKGVSTAVMGMVTPYTAAAAAVGLLVFAWYDAEKTQADFVKALALSRNEAAATTLTLSTLANQTAQSMQVTAGAGEEAALAIGNNGRIAAQNMQDVANAAVAMKELTGQAMDETVAAYAKLAQDPVKNAQKLNEQVNFMTVGLYEQIKALQEQGRNQDAATVITRAAADETVMAMAKVRASQNGVVRGWKDIVAEASKAWRAMQNQLGFSAQADQMQQMLLDNQRDQARLNAITAAREAGGRGAPAVVENALVADIKARSERIKAIAADLTKERKDAEIRELQSAAADRIAENDAIIQAEADREEKKRREVARVNGRSEQLRRQLQAAGLVKEAEAVEKGRAEAIAAIHKKYEEKMPAGLGAATRSAGLQGYRDDLVAERAEIVANTQMLRAQFSAREITATEYYARMAELIGQDTEVQAKALEGQIAYLRQQSVAGKDAINVNRQIGDLEARLAKVRTEGAAKLGILTTEEKAATEARSNAIKSYADALDVSNLALKRQMVSLAAKVGMGDREYEIQQRINEAYADEADKLNQLQMQRNAKQIDEVTFEEERAILLAKTLDRLQIIRDGYDELARAEGDWLNGAKGAWENYRQEAGNAAQQMGSAVNTVIGGFEDAWVDFTTTGKLSFSDLTRSVLADLAKIAAKQAILGVVKAVGQAWGPQITGFSDGGWTGAGGKHEPAGIVHRGEIVWSQADIMRAGGAAVVEGMRRGWRGYLTGGVVGQNMPTSIGPGGGQVIQFNSTFKVTNEGASSDGQAAGAAGNGRAVQDSFNAMANEWAVSQLRPNGVLWAMKNGR